MRLDKNRTETGNGDLYGPQSHHSLALLPLDRGIAGVLPACDLATTHALPGQHLYPGRVSGFFFLLLAAAGVPDQSPTRAKALFFRL